MDDKMMTNHWNFGVINLQIDYFRALIKKICERKRYTNTGVLSNLT